MNVEGERVGAGQGCRVGQRRGSGLLVLGILVCVGLSGCSDPQSDSSAAPTAARASSAGTSAGGDIDGLVDVGGGRKIYVRCVGDGSPTVILEGGDEDTSASYAYAVPSVAEVTRTCVYDRANLGSSDPAPGPRGLRELVADLEKTISAAKIPGPYVLVGTSGGGYITAGYAFAHARQVAGMVFVDVGSPFRNPPASLVRDTRWNSPVNIEKRDYLQVEKDGWAERERVGDIPVTVISNQYSAQEIAAAELAAERPGMRSNVEDQRGWLILSPRAKQMVVHTGHAVEEADPGLVTHAILAVVRAARAAADRG